MSCCLSVDDTQLFANIYYDFISFYLVLGAFWEEYWKQLTYQEV
jgi:hypothetical protein